jgi:hypothetical protein
MGLFSLIQGAIRGHGLLPTRISTRFGSSFSFIPPSTLMPTIRKTSTKTLVCFGTSWALRIKMKTPLGFLSNTDWSTPLVFQPAFFNILSICLAKAFPSASPKTLLILTSPLKLAFLSASISCISCCAFRYRGCRRSWSSNKRRSASILLPASSSIRREISLVCLFACAVTVVRRAISALAFPKPSLALAASVLASSMRACALAFIASCNLFPALQERKLKYATAIAATIVTTIWITNSRVWAAAATSTSERLELVVAIAITVFSVAMIIIGAMFIISAIKRLKNIRDRYARIRSA